jgi:hypothetical protein
MEQNLKNLLEGNSVEPCGDGTIKPSVICYTIVPYFQGEFHIIEPLSYDPAAPESRKYRLVSKNFAQMRSYVSGSSKPPHRELGIRSTEAPIVYKVKMRPVVVLTSCLPKEMPGIPSHFKDCVLCAPLYTFVDENNEVNQNYNPRAIQAITALQYRSFFPLPTSPYLKSKLCGLRLDRIQPTHIDCLSEPLAQVTDKWFAFIWEWIHFYATGKLIDESRLAEKAEIGKTLYAARELLLQELNKKQAS